MKIMKKYFRVSEYALTILIMLNFFLIHTDLKRVTTPELDATKWLDVDIFMVGWIYKLMIALSVIYILHFAFFLFEKFKKHHS